MIEWGPEFGSSEAVINGFSRELASASDILSKAHRRGVMMMAGTDAGQSSVPYGEWHARELECMMTYIGLTSMEAIRSATANAANALKMKDKIGTIEVGSMPEQWYGLGDPKATTTVLTDK